MYILYICKCAFVSLLSAGVGMCRLATLRPACFCAILYSPLLIAIICLPASLNNRAPVSAPAIGLFVASD